jgi:predicted ATPase
MTMTDSKKPRNIYIVGAQCTGKTTLIKALQDHFNAANLHSDQDSHSIPRPMVITETARTILQQHKFTADEITSSPTRALALQQLILDAQVQAESVVVKQGKWFISDRSGVDPLVYTRKYVGEDAVNGLIKSEEWLELKERMGESVVIVCEAGANWLMDDGVRLMPESQDDWVSFHQFFCRCLDDWGLSYEVLPCEMTSLLDRVRFVLSMWEGKTTDSNGSVVIS